MTKLTDAVRAALEKKKAAQHPQTREDNPETKPRGPGRPGAMAPAAKPMKKVTGRGR